MTSDVAELDALLDALQAADRERYAQLAELTADPELDALLAEVRAAERDTDRLISDLIASEGDE